MKESLYIDIFSKTGIMNLEDGMQKNQCWNAIVPILRGNFGEKSSLMVEFICVLAFCVFVKKSFPQDILKHQETPELGVLLRKTSLLG